MEYTISDPVYYNHKFNVEYLDARHYHLSVEVGKQTLGGTYELGRYCATARHSVTAVAYPDG
ncbi:MAG: hypothetical protein WKG07_07145 [Hymenobacter sp.]